MKPLYALELLLLAALWGASFLFMRIAVPYFGPIPLIALRVGIAALFLSPVFLQPATLQTLTLHWQSIFWLGLLTSALPFCLFAYATIELTAGYASILNATTPLWSAIIAIVWLKDRLNWTQKLGLLIGFLGVIYLTINKEGSFSLDHLTQSSMPILAALLATLSYGFGANYSKRYLTATVDPLAITAGSQLSAALCLLPLAIALWPIQTIPFKAWFAIIMMGVFCTAIALILYFRLIKHLGAAQAVSVTFLIPIFGIFWGNLFLGEPITLGVIVGGVIILVGTGLTTKVFTGLKVLIKKYI